jgi:hypothetical protein
MMQTNCQPSRAIVPDRQRPKLTTHLVQLFQHKRLRFLLKMNKIYLAGNTIAIQYLRRSTKYQIHVAFVASENVTVVQDLY